MVITFSYAGDSDFALSVKGVSVGIEDLQVYCIYYKQNILQYLHELFETGIIIYYPGVFLWFSFHPIHAASWKSACDFVPSYSSCSSCGWAGY